MTGEAFNKQKDMNTEKEWEKEGERRRVKESDREGEIERAKWHGYNRRRQEIFYSGGILLHYLS